MNINPKINMTCALITLKVLSKIDPKITIANIDIDDHGYYVDFLSNHKFSINEFKSIEKDMKKIIAAGYKIISENITSTFKANFYQNEIIIKNKNNVKIAKLNDELNVVITNDISNNVNAVKFFELTNIGGVYWNNDVIEQQLTRIYGSAFDNKNDYDDWKLFLINQKESDHRKIGQEMEIFTFSNMVGQGLPIWLPNGEIIKKEIKKVLDNEFENANFMFVDTPVLGSRQLYEISGHWEHYKENNFPPIAIDNEIFILRPMTCPHHMMIYKQKPHSYKELPIYYCENSKLHRYESSGGLIGLERVRAMELFDSHIFCKLEQIEDVISKLCKMLKNVHQKLNIKIDQIDLSLHDPKDKEKYHNDPVMWKNSENQLRKILKKLKYDANEVVGEAAFYGPKIDFQVKTNLGKIITISTIQLDFLLPKKFDLEYIDENKNKKCPVLIHFGIIGTYERFIATLLSQTKGILPFFLMPKQITIIPIKNDLHLEYSKKIYEKLKNNFFRINLDDSNERLSKKIRNAQIAKTPYQIIIGDNEVSSNNISYRQYGNEKSHICSIDEFIKSIKNQ